MSDDVAAAAAQYATPPSQDRLERCRAVVRQVRDMELRAQDLAEQLRALGRELNEARHKTLPELMNEAGVDRVGVPAQGNQPAFDAVLSPYYKANIAADWPEERRLQGFNALIEAGHSDVIRSEFVVAFGPGEEESAAALRSLLDTAGVSYGVRLAVPWTTLTALVREMHESDRPFTEAQLMAIGATVGQVVKIKERK